AQAWRRRSGRIHHAHRCGARARPSRRGCGRRLTGPPDAGRGLPAPHEHGIAPADRGARSMIATLRAAPPPTTPWGRLSWAGSDCLTVVGREINHLRRAPGMLIGALVFPAVMVVMFGYVFGSAISVPGGGNYREYLMPGLFAMTTV